MVLESIINPDMAEKHPWELFFIGFLYSSIAIFLSYFIFGGEYTSILAICFTVMASSVLMNNTLKFEEEKDLFIDSEIKLLREHGKAILCFMYLFIGFMFSFMFWFLVLNSISSEITNTVF